MKPKKPLGKGQGTLFSFFSKETPSKSSDTPNKAAKPYAPTKPDSAKKAKVASSATLNAIPTAAAGIKETDSRNPNIGTKLVGKELVGNRVKVYWPDDKEWYFGEVIDFSRDDGKHTVHYADGDKERVTLANEKVSE